jgi:hypothetical protein
MWEISYKHFLGGGSLLTVLKCKILGLMAAAKVFQVNLHKHAHRREKCKFVFKVATPKCHAIQRLWSPGEPAFHDFGAHEQIIHALCYL